MNNAQQRATQSGPGQDHPFKITLSLPDSLTHPQECRKPGLQSGGQVLEQDEVALTRGRGGPVSTPAQDVREQGFKVVGAQHGKNLGKTLYASKGGCIDEGAIEVRYIAVRYSTAAVYCCASSKAWRQDCMLQTISVAVCAQRGCNSTEYQASQERQ
jgi:hypothetical protein